MATKIFVNLPVRDLNKSVSFFTMLGYSFNPQFTNENATCMIVARDINVMLLSESVYKIFTGKEICDTSEYTETLITLSAESREKVDETIEKAVSAGGVESGKLQDQGWMYGRGFVDIDGHNWEIIYLDENAVSE